MQLKNRSKRNVSALLCTSLLVLFLGLSGCNGRSTPKQDDIAPKPPQQESETLPEKNDTAPEPRKQDVPEIIPQEETLTLSVEVYEEGEVLTYGSEVYYRYGPSIIKYDDGSMDMWISSPGNSSSTWDWIRYRHSDDGIHWSEEEIVLKPTPGSKDQCSVCDPSVIFLDGYYYLAYTATDYYEGQGSRNQAFVARSQYPDGPFEKWNGTDWGGMPEPILTYEGEPEGWGVGEPCLLIKDDDLFIFYTYSDMTGAYVELAKANLTENWPSTIRYKNRVLNRDHQDSLDVAYCEDLETFLGFSIDFKMSQSSCLAMYESSNGKEFTMIDSTKDFIKDYAHNVGFVKDPQGHMDIDDGILFGYAYGEDWGRWDFILSHFYVKVSQQ